MYQIFIALLNPFFASLKNVFAKLGLLRKGTNDMAVIFARFFYVIPFLIILLLILGMPKRIDSLFWLTMVILILLEIPSQWFFHQSIKYGNLSLVVPLTSFLIIPTFITSLIFKGWNWLGLLGALVISLGVYLLQLSQLKKFSIKNVFKPISAIITNKPSRYMLYTILIWSITTPLQKIATSQSNVPFMSIMYLGGCALGVLLYRLIRRKSLKPVLLPPEPVRLMPIGLIAGIGSVIQYWTLSILHPMYMISLKDTSLFWNILWDKIIFHKKITKLQILSTAIVMIGSFLVVYSIAYIK